MMQPTKKLNSESGSNEEFAKFVSRQLPGMKRIQRHIQPRRKRQPIGRGDQQNATRPQHPPTFGQKPDLIPQMLDHLKIGHHINSARPRRQQDKIRPKHIHRTITRPNMRDSRFVLNAVVYDATLRVDCEHSTRDRDAAEQLAAETGIARNTAYRLVNEL